MAKIKHDYMKHFSLFCSKPGGWFVLVQLWKISFKEIGVGMEVFQVNISPTHGQCVLRLSRIL